MAGPAGTRLGGLGLAMAGRAVRMPPIPDLPEGHMIELPARGRTYVVDTGPVPSARGGDAPTLVLLHALACTGLLTWYPCLDALRARYRVVVFDQRWHGQGIRSGPFVLDDCADDVAAVADALGIDRFVCAGYSMGTLVAQLAWHRHPDRVAGLVLCAGATHFAETPRRAEAVRRAGARIAAVAARQQRLAVDVLDQTADDRWAWRQFRATTGREVAAVGTVVAQFDSRPWINQVAAPTAVVVTAKDRLVPPSRQRALAKVVPGATVYDVEAGHAACVLNADRFRPALLAAAASVTGRIAAAPSSSGPR
jgi:pimeloyl-ACP methyl ester carboxylesterase